MAGDRRKRQQRVRHEAGGSAVSDTSSNKETNSETPKPQNNENKDSGKEKGIAKQPPSSRGGGKGRKGVAVATVDESRYYQPVTIMESKTDKDVDELEDRPQKYKRRGIISNWSRYEERPDFLDEVEDGSDYLIGEDFSDVLLNQSQSTGTHLQLRGEESWGYTDDTSGITTVGIGALKLTDLAATVNTIPFMEQLLMDGETFKLPDQLVDYYNQVAADNRKLYNPTKEQKDIVDTAQLIEEQMEKMKLAFFETTDKPVCKNKKNDKNLKRSTVDTSVESQELKAYQSLASTIDFNSLDEEPAEIIDRKPVDLTSKMYEAFGSKMCNDNEAFEGFITTEEISEQMVSKETEPSSAIPSLMEERHEASTEAQDKSCDASRMTTDEPTEIDFSGGVESFNFGLPKLSAASLENSKTTLDLKSLQKLNKLKEQKVDEILAPVQTLPKEPKPVESVEPIIDLNAPIVPKAEGISVGTEDTKELEDWLDSVLDD